MPQVDRMAPVPLLFEIHVEANSMALRLILVPVGEELLRRKILDCVIGNSGIFNCAKHEYKNEWIILHTAGELLTGSD